MQVQRADGGRLATTCLETTIRPRRGRALRRVNLMRSTRTLITARRREGSRGYAARNIVATDAADDRKHRRETAAQERGPAHPRDHRRLESRIRSQRHDNRDRRLFGGNRADRDHPRRGKRDGIHVGHAGHRRDAVDTPPADSVRERAEKQQHRRIQRRENKRRLKADRICEPRRGKAGRARRRAQAWQPEVDAPAMVAPASAGTRTHATPGATAEAITNSRSGRIRLAATIAVAAVVTLSELSRASRENDSVVAVLETSPPRTPRPADRSEVPPAAARHNPPATTR